MSNNTLNTDSAYRLSFSFPSKEVWEKQAMSYLAGREKALYHLLGTTNFTDFMNKIHSLLDEAGNAKEVLANFKKANLVDKLGLPKNLQFTDNKIRIVFTKPNSINMDELLQRLASDTITINTDCHTIDFVYNANNIKTFMNEFEKRDQQHQFDPNTKSMNTVNKAFRDLVIKIEEGNIGHLEINGKPTKITASAEAKSMFGYKKGDIEKAIKEDAQLKNEIETAMFKVKNALEGLCSGNPDILDAFRKVWNDKIGNDIEKFAFLSKGQNLNAGISGAIQEMYGALLIEYLARLRLKGLPESLVKIMGDVAKGGEQPKADLVILNRIGIQVKAYGMGNQIKTIEANLHPNALDKQLQPYGAVNLGDAIVQSVFNTDGNSIDFFAEHLKSYAAALLNLTTSNYLPINDTVCFYLIDAQYLVPGSDIVKAFHENSDNNSSVTITSSFKGKSTAEYNREGYIAPKTEGGVHETKNYLKYFDKEGTGNIHAELRNEKKYQALYTKEISIRTVFGYGFVDNNIYRIF